MFFSDGARGNGLPTSFDNFVSGVRFPRAPPNTLLCYNMLMQNSYIWFLMIFYLGGILVALPIISILDGRQGYRGWGIAGALSAEPKRKGISFSSILLNICFIWILLLILGIFIGLPIIFITNLIN